MYTVICLGYFAFVRPQMSANSTKLFTFYHDDISLSLFYLAEYYFFVFQMFSRFTYSNNGYGSSSTPRQSVAAGGTVGNDRYGSDRVGVYYNAVLSAGPTKLYMRGIPLSRITFIDIERFFAPLVCVDIQIGKMPDGRSSGDAIVEFRTATDARQAMSKHCEYIGNRCVKLFPSMSAQIPSHVTYESIVEIFPLSAQIPPMCPLCKVGRHKVSQCPAYKARDVCCVACKGVGHFPDRCWVFDKWIVWVSAFLGKDRDGPLLVETLGARYAHICFACLEHGHAWQKCSNGRLRKEWEEFRRLNNHIQRQSDPRQMWTEVFPTVGGGSYQRPFVHCNKRWTYTAFMEANLGPLR